jgi:hypothetical protein
VSNDLKAFVLSLGGLLAVAGSGLFVLWAVLSWDAWNEYFPGYYQDGQGVALVGRLALDAARANRYNAPTKPRIACGDHRW